MKKFEKVQALLESQVGFNLDINSDFASIKQGIKDKYPEAEFMNGQCMIFALELKRCFPQAEILFNNDHFVTLIDGEVWDYTGKVFFRPNEESNLFIQAMERAEEYLQCNQQEQS